MYNDKTALVRNLIPTSYHFDGYNEIKCTNTRDRPFFANNFISMGDKSLSIRLVDNNTVELLFDSPCYYRYVTYKPFKLTLEEYVTKLQKSVQNDSDFITFEILPQYDCHYNKYKTCPYSTKDCIQLISKHPTSVYAAVSFNSSQVKEALAQYFEITKTNNGGKSTMTPNKKNLFGMNFELGVSKDPNIAATLMGVAVKNEESGNWYTFDTTTGSRKNLANFKMGSFPILLLPTKVLIPGDLIKLNGKYFYVKSVNANKTITVLDAAAGIIQEMLPEENIILGMSLYTKVVAFDVKTLTDPCSNQGLGGNVLAAVYMMQCANNNDVEFSLDNINDDSFSGLGAFLPIILASNNTSGGLFADNSSGLDLTKLLTLGAISGGTEDNSMTQMLVLSQLLGDGNNMFASFGTPTTTNSESVKCEKCGEIYSAGTNFCSKCGGKTKTASSTCHKCNAVLAKDAAFCSNCGAKVGINACPKCGHEVTDEAKFCSACGTDLNAVQVPTNPSENE